MVETPASYDAQSLKPNAPQGCPFKGMVAPGPVAGQITHKTIPCNRDHCQLWSPAHEECALAMLGPAVALIATFLEKAFLEATQNKPT